MALCISQHGSSIPSDVQFSKCLQDSSFCFIPPMQSTINFHQFHFLTVLVSFCCCTKTLTKGWLGGKGYLVYMSKSQSILEWRQAGTQAEAGTVGELGLLAGFQGHIQLSCLFLPGLAAQGWHHHCGLGLRASIINQSRKCYTELPPSHSDGGVSSLRFLCSGVIVLCVSFYQQTISQTCLWSLSPALWSLS